MRDHFETPKPERSCRNRGTGGDGRVQVASCTKGSVARVKNVRGGAARREIPGEILLTEEEGK